MSIINAREEEKMRVAKANEPKEVIKVKKEVKKK